MSDEDAKRIALTEATEARLGPYFAAEIRTVGYSLPVEVEPSAPGLHAFSVGGFRVVTTVNGLRHVRERLDAYLAALEQGVTAAEPQPVVVAPKEAA